LNRPGWPGLIQRAPPLEDIGNMTRFKWGSAHPWYNLPIDIADFVIFIQAHPPCVVGMPLPLSNHTSQDGIVPSIRSLLKTGHPYYIAIIRTHHLACHFYFTNNNIPRTTRCQTRFFASRTQFNPKFFNRKCNI
jgi:hypothetical protein